VGARPLLAGLVAAAALAPAAHAQGPLDDDPERWRFDGATRIPVAYWQGIAASPARTLYFSGFVGLFRTDEKVRERGNQGVVIPPDVTDREGYNHIGDLAYDRREGGRLILPMECYTPGRPNGGNTCGTGSFAVADARTLRWRYYVKLDPAFIKKAMWVEVSPDGESLWTQAGDDLLRYDIAGLTPTQTAPLRPVQRLRGAANRGQYTGATFHGGRLLAAIGARNGIQVWSIDTRTGRKRLEISRRVLGESEGLAKVGARLYWTVMPAAQGGRTPTYGTNRGALLRFSPRPARRARGRASTGA
jgi:hypothetical protein